jgi:hypothetical protein
MFAPVSGFDFLAVPEPPPKCVHSHLFPFLSLEVKPQSLPSVSPVSLNPSVPRQGSPNLAEVHSRSTRRSRLSSDAPLNFAEAKFRLFDFVLLLVLIERAIPVPKVAIREHGAFAFINLSASEARYIFCALPERISFTD